MSTTQLTTTTDHDTIRAWAMHYHGLPAVLEHGIAGRENLVIDFPDEQSRHDSMGVSWGEWFGMFEERKLAFEYENQANATPYYKLIAREESMDRHLGPPGEAFQDKHINFLELEE